MISIRKAPLFAIALFTLAGTVSAKFITIPAGLFPCLLLIYSLGLLIEKKLANRRFDLILSCMALFLAFALGTLLYQLRPQSTLHSLEWVNCKTITLQGTISAPIKENAFGKKTWLDLAYVENDTMKLRVRAKLLLYLPKDDTTELAQDDSVRIRASLTNVVSPYPGYIKYLNEQGIFYAGYVKHLEKKGKHKHLGFFARYLQQVFSRRLNKIIPDSTSAGILRAMMLGDTHHLGEGVREKFNIAGAGHILSISGMHIGVIYLILNLVLGLLHTISRGRQIKHFLLLFILLVYMFISGATPAVVRSVLMYVLILLYQLAYRKYHILNIIGLAALIQLLWEPSIAFSISFQLSYAAVVGIVVIFPLLEDRFPARYLLQKHLYDWIGLTLSATLFTLPLIIVHFGKFPAYFLLSNILTSFVSTLVVWLGFITVIFSFVPLLSELLGFLSSILTQALYQSCTFVAGLPHATLEHPEKDWQAICLILLQLLLAFALFYFLPKKPTTLP